MTNAFFTGIASAVTAADAGTWKTALTTFGVGLTTVFAGLVILMCSIMVSSFFIRRYEKRRSTGKQRTG